MTRRVHLVRHAAAGDREAWRGDDSRRPLTHKGEGQAERLVALLASEPIDRVLSSPSLRCVQTVEPLARARGLRVEEESLLLEGSDPALTLEMLEALDAGGVVASTHGDIVPGVLDILRRRGAELHGEMAWQKASTWVLDGNAGEGFTTARYLPPP